MKKFCKNYLYYHLVADVLAVVVYALAVFYWAVN